MDWARARKLEVEEHKFVQPKMIEEVPIVDVKGKKVLVITSCTAQKLGTTGVKAKAKRMYQGRMFKLVRKLCERMDWDYVIISAKYGLLSPEDEIEGYEKFLKTKQDRDKIIATVIPKLSRLLPKYDRFLVIAGQKYREIIENLVDERFIVLRSKGYGDLCSRISQSISKMDTKLLDFIS